MMEQGPNPAAPPPPATKLPQSTRQKLMIGGGVMLLVVLLALVAVFKKDDESDNEPGGSTELCQLIREDQTSANRLHPSDYRDLSDFTQAELEDYVQRHCPDMLIHVLD